MVDLARLGPDVLAGILPLLYREVLEEAYAHQDAGGRRTSSPPRPRSWPTCSRTCSCSTAASACAARSRDGVYTGRPDGPFTYREGKAEAIRELADREGIDLAESYAYSDSESDLPMMRAVGHPVAVNPDRALERVAREEGWRIMRFDKLGRRLSGPPRSASVALVGGGGGYVAARRAPPPAAAVAAAALAARSRGARGCSRPRGRRRRGSERDRHRPGARAGAATNEEQVLPATSFSTGLPTVRHVFAGAPLERDRDAVVLGAEPAREADALPPPAACGRRASG